MINLMKRICWCLLMAFTCIRAEAQVSWPSPEVEDLYNQARKYLSAANMRQAIPIFQQAINLAPDQMILYRDLANAYYLSGNYEAADKTLEPVIARGQADEQCYQIAAASLVAQNEGKKAKRMLGKGIEKFPHSGLLYHEYGKLYDDENDEEPAIQQWLAGINADPAYRVNYYEAARTYMLTNKMVWAILYGEIFINMERHTPRSFETRKLVMAAYKRLFTGGNGEVKAFGSGGRTTNPANFEEAVLQTLMKLAPVVSDGISAENLTMLRTRFVMDWKAKYASSYSYTLFSYQDDLLRKGYFDAYNQWLFGTAENAQLFEGWEKFHPEAIPELDQYMDAHPLQPTARDSYNDGKVKGLFPKNPYKR